MVCMSNPGTTYSALLASHSATFKKQNRTYNILSFVRLGLFLLLVILLYFFFDNNDNSLVKYLVVCGLLFLVLIKVHEVFAFRKQTTEGLVKANEIELAYLNERECPFENGAHYLNPSHNYSFDLDFFGERTLYHHLNRAKTFSGKDALANGLLTMLPNEKIKANQDAVKELTDEIDWRQALSALGAVVDDNEIAYKRLLIWSKGDVPALSGVMMGLSFVLPIAFIVASVLYAINLDPMVGNIATGLFIFNLGILSRHTKYFKTERIGIHKVDKIIRNYGLIIKHIEEKEFKSERLKKLQTRLNNKGKKSSELIAQLSTLFGQIENMSNPLGLIIFNGSLLYHVHVLRIFSNWKKNNASEIENWLDVIGELEFLSCLANFSFNNPEFVYPELNSSLNVEFENLGHPLLNKADRIDNSVSFNAQRFIILTGSNMSGKSTFLRSLGVNMVLGGIGSPLCSSKASLHPLKVYTSMRVSDSLNENESYFFAEVKRLKQIMDELDKETGFVLLDEILRGTNSDDKREGTVEVIKRIVAKKSVGAIATHDVLVCNTTAEYPDALSNQCFEAEIVDDELFFDYKLREGVCKNKSATFLMKKMGVI
ncbi:MAG: hypothetical protein ACI959_000108 [Limisphaerales bacterium]|jgi:hypothetical protein